MRGFNRLTIICSRLSDHRLAQLKLQPNIDLVLSMGFAPLQTAQEIARACSRNAQVVCRAGICAYLIWNHFNFKV